MLTKDDILRIAELFERRKMINDARDQLSNANPAQAEKILEQIEKIFRRSKLPGSDMSLIKYDILELKTDIDLAILNDLA